MEMHESNICVNGHCLYIPFIMCFGSYRQEIQDDLSRKPVLY